MKLLASLLFAISANMDNIVVGLSYGINKIRVGAISNLLIAFITCIGTIVSMQIGKVLFFFVPIAVSNIIGGVLLILIGIGSLCKAILENKRKIINSKNSDYNIKNCIDILDSPEKADSDKSGTIDARESVSLALALSINNIGLGIGASITGINIFITALITFVFSMLTIIMGCYLGRHYFSKILGKNASIVAALLIILLGLYETLI